MDLLEKIQSIGIELNARSKGAQIGVPELCVLKMSEILNEVVPRLMAVEKKNEELTTEVANLRNKLAGEQLFADSPGNIRKRRLLNKPPIELRNRYAGLEEEMSWAGVVTSSENGGRAPALETKGRKFFARENCSSVIDKLRKSKIAPNRFHVVRQGETTVVETNLQGSDADQIKEDLQKADITVNEIRKRNPCVSFVSSMNSAEEGKIDLLEHNTEVFVVPEDIVRITSQPTRDKGAMRYYAEVSPSSFTRLVRCDMKLLIGGWEKKRVNLCLWPKRCTFCAGLGHTKKFCRANQQSKRPTCFRCSGEHDDHRSCTAPVQCAVCIKLIGKPIHNSELGKSALFDADMAKHHTLDGACPQLQTQVRRMIEHTDFGMDRNANVILKELEFMFKPRKYGRN